MARHVGYSCCGPLRLFVELSLLFGSSFTEDPQYPWVREALHPSPMLEMTWATRLHERASDVLDAIHGPDNVYTNHALVRLEAFAAAPPALSADTLVDGALAALARIHPQKFAYIGEVAAQQVVDLAQREAQRQGVDTPHATLLFAVLMFSFGSGCTRDPLYPWIERTLANPIVDDARMRVARVQQKALTWLRHVLEHKGVDRDGQ